MTPTKEGKIGMKNAMLESDLEHKGVVLRIHHGPNVSEHRNSPEFDELVVVVFEKHIVVSDRGAAFLVNAEKFRDYSAAAKAARLLGSSAAFSGSGVVTKGK
jgi:hypothetical protein